MDEPSGAFAGDGDPLSPTQDRTIRGLARRHWPAVVFAFGCVVVAAGLYRAHVESRPPPGTGGFEPVDWLLVLALWVGTTLVLSLARRSDRARDYAGRAKDSPAAVASLGTVAGLLLVGLFGPLFVTEPTELAFSRAYLPPVWASVDTAYLTGDCLGSVVNGRCRGTWQYPFGTTRGGQDLFSFVVLGTRTAVELALVTSLLLTPVGVGIGLVSGLVGGRVDAVLMRVAETLATVPAVVVYLLFSMGNAEYRLLALVLAFGLVNWGGLARAVRNETLELRDQSFVRAARAGGASRWHVVRYHLLPNVSRPVLATLGLQIPMLVVTEAALSFVVVATERGEATLGDPTVVSWGQLLYVGIQVDGLVPAWWVTVLPTVALVLTALSVATLCRSLSDVFAPVRSP